MSVALRCIEPFTREQFHSFLLMWYCSIVYSHMVDIWTSSAYLAHSALNAYRLHVSAYTNTGGHIQINFSYNLQKDRSISDGNKVGDGCRPREIRKLPKQWVLGSEKPIAEQSDRDPGRVPESSSCPWILAIISSLPRLSSFSLFMSS